MGGLLSSAVALVVKVVVTFAVITGLVFIVAPEDAGHVRAKAIGTISFVIGGVVDLVQSSSSAVKEHM
jgi:hypothetical protein